jgi:3'-phosphoadenosine 5'-phosphosulfate sulfotransferase (PAPS reductase)/FAD synthetase
VGPCRENRMRHPSRIAAAIARGNHEAGSGSISIIRKTQTIFILRKAYHRLKTLGLLWSLGKDSNVLFGLTQSISLPRAVSRSSIGTARKFPGLYVFRDRYTPERGLDLILGEGPPLEDIDPTRDADHVTTG